MSERQVLGIDLGTTYSCVAHLDSFGQPAVLPNADGTLTTPSVVYFEGTDSAAVVGESAKNELKRQPGNVVDLIKRHMGEEGFAREIDGTEYSPQRISALILKQIALWALEQLGADVPADGVIADAVITVPAYFGAAERQATRDAGKMAGLNVLNIVNEPTAAAYAYGATGDDSEQNVLVYDLGGGTFDVTVIKVGPGEVRVVATDGDHRLGGADWDERVVDLLAEKFTEQKPEAGDPREDPEAVGEMVVLAERAKKDLSRKETYRTAVTAHRERASFEITRAELDERTADLVDRTLEFTASILKTARDKGVSSFDQVLLVGGMSRTPAVAARLAERFPELPAPRLSDPDHIVAKGAALLAARQVAETVDQDGRQSHDGRLPGPGPRIVNVSSKGYGVRVVRDDRDQVGHVAWLIRPQDEVPAAPRETFRTVSDGQTEVNVEVFESLTADLDDRPSEDVNKKLVEGTLKGLPPRQPAGQPLEVDFGLGDDGILRITARSANGRQLRLEARISGATSEEDMNTPLPALQL